MPERPIRLDSAQTDEFTCAVKDRIVEMPIELDGSNGPQVACGTDHGFFVYEFKIPLKDSEVRYYGIGAEEGTTITIGANWGKMERRAMQGMRPAGGGMPGGGIGGGPPGGGRSGGGMNGGPPGGAGGERPDMAEEQEIWIRTTLAAATEKTETN
jgi:hypothetical protein